MERQVMARTPYPSETQDRFLVRLPDGMRDRIKSSAKASNRAMNAEIIACLQDSFDAKDRKVDSDLSPMGASMVSEIVFRIQQGLERAKESTGQKTDLASIPLDDLLAELKRRCK